MSGITSQTWPSTEPEFARPEATAWITLRWPYVLIKRRAAIGRGGQYLQRVAVLDEGVAADPRGIELGRDQQGGDVAIGAPVHHRHHPAR